MTSNVLCKYFMNGACAFGDNCRFSHNRSDESSQVCKYYLAGNCAYGDRCRYEHSKPAWSARGQPAPPSRYTAPTGVPKPHVGPPPPSAAPAAAANGTSSLASLPSGASDLGLASSGQPNWDDFMTPDEMEEFEQWQVDQAAAAASSTRPPQAGSVRHPSGDFADIMDPADIPLCNEYAATGYCSAGDECLYIHGDPCESCQRHVLHPANPTAAAAHTATCNDLADRIARRQRDGQVECAICLEKVLSKAEPSARRFGLLACSHAFCLGCIRNWRSADDSEADTKTALRTCPICRCPTHFVTPSTRWPESEQEKTDIVAAYKVAMAEKDCVNFAFGEGSCPFGTSCFYRHAYRDGRLEEVHLRRAGTADGGVKVLGPVKLSSFLEASLTAQMALRRRPQQQRGAAAAAAAARGASSSRSVVQGVVPLAAAATRGGSGEAGPAVQVAALEQQQQQQDEQEERHKK